MTRRPGGVFFLLSSLLCAMYTGSGNIQHESANTANCAMWKFCLCVCLACITMNCHQHSDVQWTAARACLRACLWSISNKGWYKVRSHSVVVCCVCTTPADKQSKKLAVEIITNFGRRTMLFMYVKMINWNILVEGNVLCMHVIRKYFCIFLYVQGNIANLHPLCVQSADVLQLGAGLRQYNMLEPFEQQTVAEVSVLTHGTCVTCINHRVCAHTQSHMFSKTITCVTYDSLSCTLAHMRSAKWSSLFINWASLVRHSIGDGSWKLNIVRIGSVFEHCPRSLK